MLKEKSLLKREYICPYCFNKHPLFDVQFRCENPRCILEEDYIEAEFRGMRPRELQHVITPTEPVSLFDKLRKGMPTECACDECNEVSRQWICPSCHFELPSTMGEYDDLIFAVIGAKETGKSHYISVLIDKINKEIGDAYHCHLQPINDDTIQRYRDVFWAPVFKRNETIVATRSGLTDERTRQPLLYTLQFTKKNLFQSKSRIYKVITLAFFDAAGEDLDAEDTMSTVNKYIYNARGVILLLDPLQLATVRNKLKGNVQLPNVNAESGEILYRMTNLIRKAKQLKQTEKIDIPIAVTFSKIDAVKGLLDPSSSLRFPSQHTESKAFDLTDFKNVQTEIEALIQDWSETGIPRTLDANYKNYGYFGISSLGNNPKNNIIINNLNPYRVEDPFLWLLYKHKIIGSKK